MQFVRLVNVGDKPYDFHQSNRKRILQPGEEAMVPWDVATSLFGDPTATNTTKDMARQRAWDQAAANHNYRVGTMTAEQWEERRPKIAVFDVETGNRIYMVLEDQDGTLYSGQAVPSNSTMNVEALQAQIAQLTKTVDVLVRAQLAAVQGATGQTVVASADAAPPAAPVTGFDLPTTASDTPPAVAGADVPPPPATLATTKQAGEDTPQTVPVVKRSKLAAKHDD